ncbi:hypothetical protein GQ43DRAFT_214728 [Delitschia confertaspora ATCC 74209]|uniref:Uncharacterized protein n=1 Tax=Delitschia confertaspora ATCC 74209 TaxID=1513339 RepID=A0A9P4JTA8_9PLEO|nr:hypothetical protein GQ43DRAFT_214728 [Delitschia confertaspora ATCC 74209]
MHYLSRYTKKSRHRHRLALLHLPSPPVTPYAYLQVPTNIFLYIPPSSAPPTTLHSNPSSSAHSSCRLSADISAFPLTKLRVITFGKETGQPQTA